MPLPAIALVMLSAAPQPCAAVESQPIAAPRTADEKLYNATLAGNLDWLHQGIGRLTRGEVPLYEGTLQVREGMGRYQASVVAVLLEGVERRFSEPPGSELTIIGATVGSAATPLRISQLDSKPDDSTFDWGDATCLRCMSRLKGGPALINLAGVARGKWGDGEPLELELKGQLRRLRAGEVTIEHVKAITLDLGASGGADPEDFVFEGDEFVWTTEQRFELGAVPAPSARWKSCERRLIYSVTYFVNRACPARYGVRDVAAKGHVICCVDPRNLLHGSNASYEQATCWDEGGSPRLP